MPVSRPSRHEIAAISAGKDHTLARLRTGEVLGWGGAGSGRMSTPDRDICSPFRTTDAKPVYVAKSSRYADVSAGYGVSLGISDTRQTLIWGFCQVGLGGTRGFTEEPILVDGISNASKVVAGQLLHAAIDQSGDLYTWGMSTDGALGRTAATINARPGVVRLPATQAIAIGDAFMVALSTEGRLHAWGSNSAGQLGLGHLESATSPQSISLGSRVKAIAAGSTHVLALTASGQVFGWGSNHFGQVSFNQRKGRGAQAFMSEPVPIDLPEPTSALAAGMHYSVALGRSGRVYTWGWNGFGQLGHGDLEARDAPTVIRHLSGVRAIAAGEAHVVATGETNLLGWGCNESGQLGSANPRQMSPHALLAIAGSDRARPD